MIAWMLVCCCIDDLSVDGEKYDVEQGQYFNEQDQQEHFEQGKYNMGLSLLPTHFIIIIIHVACV